MAAACPFWYIAPFPCAASSERYRGHSGQRRTCCRFDPVAIDPKLPFRAFHDCSSFIQSLLQDERSNVGGWAIPTDPRDFLTAAVTAAGVTATNNLVHAQDHSHQ